MWYKPLDLRKVKSSNDLCVSVLDEPRDYSFDVETFFGSDENVGDIQPYLSEFNSQYRCHEVFLANITNATIGPKPIGLPRYWPIFFDDNYVWNLLSDEAKNKLENQGILKKDGDLLSPNIPDDCLYLKNEVVWLYTFFNIDHLYRETLPALLALKWSGYDLGELYFLVPHLPEDLLSLILKLGVLKERLISIENCWIQVERLIIPSFVTFGHLHTPSRWYLESSKFIREQVSSQVNTPKPRKIYVSRANAAQRKILNEMELIASLEKDGFFIIEPGDYSKEDQISIFSEAEVIVGPHGMGIANTIFSSKLKLLVEIMTTDWNRVSYFRNAQLQGARYGSYWVKPLDQPNSRSSKMEYILDISSFKKFLDKTLVNL